VVGKFEGLPSGLVWLVVFLTGSIVQAARPEGPGPGGPPTNADPRFELTVELTWTVSPPPVSDGPGGKEVDRELTVELSDGRILEVIPWKSDGSGRLADRFNRPTSRNGRWVLGTDRTGRVRARVESTLHAGLIVRSGDQAVRIPVASILDRPQRTPAESVLSVAVERLPWDSLTVEIAPRKQPAVGESPPGLSGVAAPGATVPVTVGHRIVSTDADQVTVTTTLSLRPVRGGAAVWKQEQQETVTTNRIEPTSKVWNLTAPTAEGSYVLEVHSAWEATAGAGVRDGSSRHLGRLIRRRRAASAVRSAHRRVGLVVFDAKGSPPSRQTTPTDREREEGAETEVDSLDLSRVRNGRFAASGRSPREESKRSAWQIPAAALREAGRRDGLRAWIPTAGVDLAKLGAAEQAGNAWSAAGMKVSHPDRPHRLILTVAGGDPRALSVAVVDPGTSGQRPRVVLDACMSSPPILPAGGPATASWLIWPDTVEPTLILVNRNAESPVKLGTVRLVELADLPPPPFIFEPKVGPTRALGLYLAGPDALDRFGGGGEPGFLDVLAAGRHLARYLGSCGATEVVLPESLTDRASRLELRGQSLEDSTSPDRLDLLLMVLHRYGCRAWLEVDFDSAGGLAGLPAPDSAAALERGLVRVGRTGQADGPAYHPLHDDVRSAMKHRVTEAITGRRSQAALSGLLIRLGPGPTLLGTPETGLDDSTYERFVHETFGAEVAKEIPGLGKTDADRYGERSRYVSGVGRVPWLTWRSRAIASLYNELSRTVRTVSPGAELAVATPTLDDGPAGDEARRVDLSGLSPAQAWRSVGLDLQAWPNGPDAPIVVRTSGLSTDELARDLATSSDLDAKVATRSRRGMMLLLDDELPAVADGLGSPLPPLPPGPDDAPEPWAASKSDSVSFRPYNPFQEAVGSGSGTGLWLKALPLAEGPTGDESFGHALASFDAQWALISSRVAGGNEERLRRFASVLRSIPALPAETPPPSLDTSRLGVTLRTTRNESQTYLAIANDTPYPIRLATILDGVDASTPIDDLGRGMRLAVQAAEGGGGRMLVVDLPPFGASAIRVGIANAAIRSVTPYPSQVVLSGMEAHYKELSSQLARLNRSLSGGGTVELPSPGFEPAREPQIQRTARRVAEPPAGPPTEGSELGLPPVGWKLEGGVGASAVIDGENPHSGQGSVKLVATGPSASLVSDPFSPNTLSALTIEAFLRSGVADAKVRVWIEAQAEGKPFVRRSELVVSPDWSPRAFRAADIPASGLDSARLRFEMLTPGALWIDDVRVINEQASKSARLNAQRSLLSALQAYREKRYADFARLGTSHWTKHPGVLGSIRLDRTATASNRGISQRPGTDPAEASALPDDRAVR
jgi:hypothetical protein